MSLLNYGFSSNKRKKSDDDVDKNTSTSRSDQKKSKSDLYDKTKRKRTFQSQWCKIYPWLVEREGKMFCSVCTEFSSTADRTSSFYTGNDGFRVSSIKAHDKNKSHWLCMEAKKSKDNPDRAGMRVALRNLNQQIFDKLEILFNTSYYIAKEERPFTDFPKLCSLQSKNKIDIGVSYQTDKKCKEFIGSISEVMKNTVSGSMSHSFFSLMVDGGTDTSTKDLELMYIRYLDKGVPVNQYLTVHELANGTADGIIETIDRGVRAAGLDNWKEKLVHFGSDGASVYTGSSNGVHVKLKNDIPWLTGFWCVAHNLELAALDALKSEKLLDDVKELLKYIYKYYKYSPKAVRELKEIAQIYEESVIKPVNVVGTRWLPHLERALKAFMKSFLIIHAHFHNALVTKSGSVKMQGKAKFVITFMEKYKNVAFMCFMLDLLEVLAKVSLVFQRDSSNINDVKDTAERALLSLIAMHNRPGPNLQDFLTAVGQGTKFHDVELHKNDNDLQALENTKNRILDLLNDFIDSRFKCWVQNPMMKASDVMDVAFWPNSRQELATYGDDMIQVLLDYWRVLLETNEIQFDEVLNEWTDFKVLVSGHFRHLSYRALYEKIINEYSDRFPNLIVLFELVLIMPLSTSCVERGFSAVKRIKTDWRSSLSVEALDHLMRISVNGPSIADYDPALAIEHWWDAGDRARRPTAI